jgi:hypothetical protein
MKIQLSGSMALRGRGIFQAPIEGGACPDEIKEIVCVT